MTIFRKAGTLLPLTSSALEIGPPNVFPFSKAPEKIRLLRRHFHKK